MATIFEVPTQPTLPQTFIVTLNGTAYRMTLRWNKYASSWTMDLADSSSNPILLGRPLITGADLLEQFAYLNIAAGGALLVQSDNDADLVPDVETLGVTGHLFFVSPQ